MANCSPKNQLKRLAQKAIYFDSIPGLSSIIEQQSSDAILKVMHFSSPYVDLLLRAILLLLYRLIPWQGSRVKSLHYNEVQQVRLYEDSFGPRRQILTFLSLSWQLRTQTREDLCSLLQSLQSNQCGLIASGLWQSDDPSDFQRMTVVFDFVCGQQYNI